MNANIVTEQWLTTEAAAALLCVTTKSLASYRKHFAVAGMTVARVNPYVRAVQGAAVRFSRLEVEHVALIRKRVRCSVAVACRIAASIKKDGPIA